MKKYLAAAGVVLLGATAFAADLIPYTFTPGTPIRSAEVNANFSSLQSTTVAHASRIQALEAAGAKPLDQLFCVTFSSWVVDGKSSFPCIQASNPATTRDLTMAQVLAEGWISVAIGGGDTNRLTMSFRK